ncbi:ATP-binding domain-containing protein, partial [Paracoccaceae bacterium]|nr:ATP-binding domain-containing protein [Paracoccaceae bacterium]
TLCSLEKSEIYQDFIGSTERADNEYRKKGIIFDSVWRFKGLERQIVLLTDLTAHNSEETLFYVAATRARVLLVIFSGASQLEKLRNL